ncbi:LysM peptidoglycan-binding domain-containing protein [Rufibacter sediminis]|uniref:LysM peptidoglycan-binding domain-containing protein n=1 Tax=Rufibacter sediminis TaxID=2762756 RepID=A0ABR6VLV4_9BACT|nr:LysM peptidoglycan-binding domain-containing protein [Rufibacter sediminis]MBC3538214.1 LysM peptidoglycan-binding domain-containing protein [Rufibacter sediminis]
MLKKFVFVLGCLLVSYGAASAETLFPRDSTGVKVQNGKTYITHKVTPGETLYGLARKYAVGVDQIVAVNKNVNKSLIVGQTVLIPMRAGSTSTAAVTTSAAAETPVASPAANRTYEVDAKGNKIHTVQARQTMFSIANLHQVSIDDLKKWNNLTSSTVKVGQKMIVGVGAKAPAQASGTQTASKVYVPESDDVVTTAKQPATNTAAAATPAKQPATSTAPVATTAKTTTPAPAKAEADEDKPAASKTSEYVSRINESGMAEQIETRTDANKFLALHKSAPVGTIMAVKNPMNDQTVYVRVIGKLPATGDNDKVVVKLSRKACQQIGAVDKRFRVEVSYMP